MKRSDEVTIQSIDGRLSVLHDGRWFPVPSGGDGTGDEPTGDEGNGDAAPAQPADGGSGETHGSPPAQVPPEPNQGADGEPNPAPVHPETPSDEAIVETPEDDLRALHATLDAYRADARERLDVDGVRYALAQMERISAEIGRRRAEEQARIDDLAALDAETPAALPEPAPVLAGSNAGAAQLASIRTSVTGGQAPAAQTPPPPAPARPRAAMVAAVSSSAGQVSPGQEIGLDELGRLIDAAKTGREGQAILASVPSFAQDPEGVPELLTTDHGASYNDRLIHEAQEDWRSIVRRGEDPARMAAARQAAICGPYDIIRDIPDAFATSTPVADLFPSRPAGRGGFQYTVSGVLSDVTGAVSLWNEANQAAVDTTNASTWKPCKTFVCPPTSSAVVEAIVECVTFDNTLEMSNPERVRNLNNAVEALSARTYEGRILQRIDALSHPFRFTGDYGALPALVEAINSLVPQLTWWNRLEPNNLDLILPPGVLQILAIDKVNRAYGSEMEGADVLRILQANLEGVARIVVALDPSLGGEPGTFADPLPSVGVEAQRGAVPYISGGVYRLRLVDPSAAIYATTGEVNAGVLRDANMVRQNRTGYFTERFFMLEKNGPQPWANIDVKLCADGSRAGLIAPNGCAVS